MAARECARFELRGEVPELGGHERLGTGEQVIEGEQDRPILQLLFLRFHDVRLGARRIFLAPPVVQLPRRLDRHRQREPLPEDERRAGDPPTHHRLSPSREEHRAPHRAEVVEPLARMKKLANEHRQRFWK